VIFPSANVDTAPEASGLSVHARARTIAGKKSCGLKETHSCDQLGARLAHSLSDLLAGGTSASATSIDLSTWTCAKFQAADKDDIGVILAWMDGYYRGEDDPPVIDTEKFVANAKKLGEYCAAHPDTGIITAADELFAK